MLFAGVLLAAAVTACNGGGQNTAVTPLNVGPPASGALSLGTTSVSQSVAVSNGISAILTYAGGTGSVTATSSGTAPAGTTSVTPADVRRVAASTPSPTSPIVYYITIASSTGATLSGLPAVTLSLPGAPVGMYQEAQFAGGTWTNVTGAVSTVNPSGSAVEFPIASTPITIPANGAIFLAFYQGNYPQPTPTPVATPTNIIKDSAFESGTFGAYGAAVNATGWTQCAISKAVAGATLPHKLSTFTPAPGSTPGAVIQTAGTTLPIGTATPLPTISTVQVVSPTHAAVIGGLFSNFNQEDFAYNGLCQIVTVPKAPTLSFSLLGNGNETASFFDFDINVLDATGAYVANLYDEGFMAAQLPGDTKFRSVSVPGTVLAPYVGKTVTLFVGGWVGGGNSTRFSGYYFVDDFNLSGVP